MKKLVALGVLLASVAAFATIASAYSSPGSPTGYVNDFAKVLRPDTKQALEAELTNFKQTTSNEITVATIPNMGGDYIENYAVKLFAEWGVGTKDKDNGVLLLLSIEEHKMRIEVGYGLEGALPDSIAQSILNNEMTPLLKAGDYDGAVTAGVRAIELATKGEYTATAPKPANPIMAFLGNNFEFVFITGFFILQFLASIFARSRSWWAGGVVGFIGGLGISLLFSGLLILLPIVLFTLFGLLFDYIVSSGYQKAKANGTIVPWWFGGPGGMGGVSSGGGFGGFGGGGSGGGGASGSW
ncbi:MAG: TPM domain-containing protein [Candidatus Kaiserbacteria bacterium]|nr:TPM domain-containing protein [Candidatus Kaiserbacteria bacterium]